MRRPVINNDTFYTKKITNKDIYDSLQGLHKKQDEFHEKMDDHAASDKAEFDKVKMKINWMWGIGGFVIITITTVAMTVLF